MANSDLWSCKRRDVLVAAVGSFALGACGGESATTSGPKPVDPLSMQGGGPQPADDGVVSVRYFYRDSDGINLQPAFQKAIDYARDNGLGKVANDLPFAAGEMWAPVRERPFGPENPSISREDNLSPDGIPLVVSHAVDLDFRGIALTMKGPFGGARDEGQPIGADGKPWLGGWLYLIGGPHVDHVRIANVRVDGGYRGEVHSNPLRNLTDKGFRLQDTEVGLLELEKVELRDFAGEIYFVAGTGAGHQNIVDCHFHGSPQCAFNTGAIGTANIRRLKAGRSYQAAEVLGGPGQSYQDCIFYDAPKGGASLMGGPSPRPDPAYPFWYPQHHSGAEPFIDFSRVRFVNCHAVGLGSWIRGDVELTDSILMPRWELGATRKLEIDATSICDQRHGYEAVAMDGPRSLDEQVPQCPNDTFYEPMKEMRLRVKCKRTDFARQSGYSHGPIFRFFGGLMDNRTLELQAWGEAMAISEVFGTPASGFEPPVVLNNGFIQV